MNKVRRALISVYNKDGIVPFARSLAGMGVQIVSTGGTASLLRGAGIDVTDVSSVTKFPEMLDGRVKTLHPNLHAGLLALRDNPEHVKTLEKHKIAPIELVVVNLYPFWDAVRKHSSEFEIIEMIDIGGPSMLRSAAKNFRHVAAVCDPADYAAVESELRAGDRTLGDATRRRLAAKVFAATAAYDGLIADYFAGGKGAALPARVRMDFEKTMDLRYGENPHQKAALYREARSAGVVGAEKLHGKELSFNNILDLDAALEMAEAFSEPACAIVKHTSPCGFALGRDGLAAFKNAHRCDPLSAFGGIVALNTRVDGALARQILKSGFLECIIARGFSKDALAALKAKKNLRLLSVGAEAPNDGRDFKKVKGGLLVQDRDVKDPAEADLRCVTKTRPRKADIADLLFAFKVCRYVKSNAIVVAKGGMTVGLGMGQPSRVDSCLTAFRKAGKRSRGAVLASDGFFPKPDSIALAKRHGVRAIIQPGGSIQDEAVIRACDRAKIAMVFTGIRHFKH